MGCHFKTLKARVIRRFWAAALTLFFSVPTYAEKPPPCGKPDKAGRVPRMTEVLACQKLMRGAFPQRHLKRTGHDPSPEERERFEDLQRAQMRAYMEAYPDEATIEGEVERPAEAERRAETVSEPQGVLERIAEAVGLAKEALASALGGKAKAPETKAATPAEAEARQVLGGLQDGKRMGEVDLEKIAAQARKDPKGTLKRAVIEHNKQFEENVPDEVKRFYRKPGTAAELPPETEE